MEDNSEIVQIGRAIHEEKADLSDAKGGNTEIALENIRLDKLTKDYLVEVKNPTRIRKRVNGSCCIT